MNVVYLCTQCTQVRINRGLDVQEVPNPTGIVEMHCCSACGQINAWRTYTVTKVEGKPAVK